MKKVNFLKYFINLFLIFSSLYAWSADGKITVSLSTPSITVEKNSANEAIFVEINNKLTRLNGYPGDIALPWFTLSILLPPEANLATIKVKITDILENDLEGNYLIAPMQQPESERIAALYQISQSVAALDVFEPQDYLQNIRGSKIWIFKILNLEMFTFKYNESKQKLRSLISGKLDITYEKEPEPAPPITTMPPINYLELIKKKVNNFDSAIGNYIPPDRISPDENKKVDAESLDNQYQQLPAPAIEPSYYIITTDYILKNSKSLPAFYLLKQEQGFKVHILTENAWGGGMGDVAAEHIRNWLRTNYITNRIQYVLFIGDPNPATSSVPMKLAYPLKDNTIYPDCPTDFYYTEMSGNWDLDGDGKYGEYIDDFGTGGAETDSEINVGRIPYYDNMDDLDQILTKLFIYENNLLTNQAWRKNILLPMKPMDTSTPTYHLGEEVITNIILPSGDWQYHRIYEESYNLNPPPETYPCTIANVTSVWGSRPFGVTAWMTHGSFDYAADILSSADTYRLNNNYPSFVFLGSCSNGFPELQNNLGYSLLKRGALNTVSCSRVSWYFPGEKNFNSSPTIPGIAYEYTKRLISDSLPSGNALNELKFIIAPGNEAFWMNYLDFNIYGDPLQGLNTSRNSLLTKLNIVAVEASTYQSPHTPANSIDGNMITRWAAEGVGQWIIYDMGKIESLTALKMAFYNGIARDNFITIDVSDDKTNWQTVFTGQTIYRTNQFQIIDLNNCLARYVKITGRGNTSINSPNWNSYAEIEIWGFAQQDADLPAIRIGTTEAENLKLENYIIGTHAGPSGGKLVSLTAHSGKATGKFTGPSDSYSINIKYVDEEDGAANWKLLINGIVRTEWTGNQNTGSNWFYLTRVNTNVPLNTGDKLELQGTLGDGENARIDYIEITKTIPGQIIDLNAGSTNPYMIVEKNLKTDIQYYTDRTYIINNLPNALTGATYIKTPNADKAQTKENFLCFRTTLPATVYLAYDSRAATVPDWLSDWTKTGERIVTSDINSDFILYSKAFSAYDLVILGANLAPGYSGNVQTNYIIIVQ